MHLETQKTIAKSVGVVVVGGLAVYGLVSVFNGCGSNHRPSAAPKQTPETTVVEVQKPQNTTPHKKIVVVQDNTTQPKTQQTQATTTTEAPKGKDGDAEKQQKISNLEVADLALLRGMGYKVLRREFPFGRGCDCEAYGPGKTDGTGYHGTSTSISYSVVAANGTPGLICVAHSGKGGTKAAVGSFKPN